MKSKDAHSQVISVAEQKFRNCLKKIEKNSADGYDYLRFDDIPSSTVHKYISSKLQDLGYEVSDVRGYKGINIHWSK